MPKPARPTEADEVRWYELAKPLSNETLMKRMADSSQPEGFRRACDRELAKREGIRDSIAKAGGR